jgi:ribonucleoside-triphosphate reductase
MNYGNLFIKSILYIKICIYSCLVETFPDKHESLEDFKKTLKYAYLYAKTVTLGRTHWPESNRVLLRNRRIGCSLSGIAQFLSTKGLHSLKEWCIEGYNAIQQYDKVYSDWLAIPRSIKTTCIKPSGTVSLLAGATPGMHYPTSSYYIRRVRLPNTSELLPSLKEAGYFVEAAVESPETTVVVEFPVNVGSSVRKSGDVSMWEQLSLASFLQEYWADNQVRIYLKNNVN